MFFVRSQPCIFFLWYRGNIKLISEGIAIQTERSFESRVKVSAHLWLSVQVRSPAEVSNQVDGGKTVNSFWLDVVLRLDDGFVGCTRLDASVRSSY